MYSFNIYFNLLSWQRFHAKIQSVNVNYVYIPLATDAIHSSNIFSSLRTVLLSFTFFVTFILYILCFTLRDTHFLRQTSSSVCHVQGVGLFCCFSGSQSYSITATISTLPDVHKHDKKSSACCVELYTQTGLRVPLAFSLKILVKN